MPAKSPGFFHITTISSWQTVTRNSNERSCQTWDERIFGHMRCYKGTERQGSELPLPAQVMPGNFGPDSAQLTSATSRAKPIWRSNGCFTSAWTRTVAHSGWATCSWATTNPQWWENLWEPPLSCPGITTAGQMLQPVPEWPAEHHLVLLSLRWHPVLGDSRSRSRGGISLILQDQWAT